MPENKKKYTGAWCPSITPFDADGKLDLAALEKHFSRLSEAGTDGVLLMGSIGEFTALSMDERVSLIHAARTMTHLPLIANVSGTCMEDMTRLADAAYSEGYEAVMALPHYYFAQTPRQLEAYFDTLGGRFEGEWLIYNFPARTGCDVDAALIAKLAPGSPVHGGEGYGGLRLAYAGHRAGPRPRCARIFRCCAGSTSISSPT